MNETIDRRHPPLRRGTSCLQCMAHTSHRGFTLIELAVTLAIFAVLTMLAVPSFKAWLLSSQVRNAAESVQNGLQIARAAAIQRNQLTTFTPQTTAPAGWTVRLADGTTVQTWAAAEGAQNTTLTPNDDGTNQATQATFNGLGARVNNSDGSLILTQISVAADAANTADVRNLNVVIGASGSIKMCDPHLSAGDPRAC